VATTMDEYAPFDDGPGANTTEAGWRKIMSPLSTPGAMRDILNGLSVYADSTGMQVKVRTGEVWAQGHRGAISTEKTLAIASSAGIGSGQERRDRVIYRVDYTNNRIELDVLTGTPATVPANGPALTRNSTIFEGSLAEVVVPQSDVSIDAAQVYDARVFGGPTTDPVSDDSSLFGDKLSTVERMSVTQNLVGGNNFNYVVLAQASRDVSATTLRFYLGSNAVAGTATIKIYTGYHRFHVADTMTVTPTVTSGAGDVKIEALPSTLTIQAGQYVAFAFLSVGASTVAGLGYAAAPISANLINTGTTANDPASRWRSVTKASGTLPSTINGHDGTWTKHVNVPWFALG
jgi:hypothetical protein